MRRVAISRAGAVKYWFVITMATISLHAQDVRTEVPASPGDLHVGVAVGAKKVRAVVLKVVALHLIHVDGLLPAKIPQDDKKEDSACREKDGEYPKVHGPHPFL